MIEGIWLYSLPALIAGFGGWTFLRRRRLRGRKLYQQHLEQALADGILTDDEARELETVRAQGDLSAAEVRMVAVSLYRRALKDAIADSRITEEEDESLRRMREQLGLSDDDLANDVAQLQRIRLFAGIERGDLPKINAPITLADGEVCHWVVQGTLADQLVVPGRRTDLEAVSFEVDKTLPFAVNGPRSALRPSEEILPIDMGLVVVTNRRTVFQGARRTVNIPHMKLRTLDLFVDGIALDEADPAHTSFLLLADPELSAAILLYAARKRKNELKNLTTRTA
ncbi:MAG TPA: hypothetical protein VM100_13225 [Longimicrobiales bacterium]|nr:hypothetical protein [Longimicrobiales bacterium]